MKIHIISFTNEGSRLNAKLQSFLSGEGNDVTSYCTGKNASGAEVRILQEPLKEWTKKSFSSCEAIIFIGACGVAVRSIAPYVADKRKDPAVIVIDEKGQYVIPVLSGHIGGANELSHEIAPFIHGLAVITTATDIHSKFAVDVFAKKNQMYIENMKIAKEISAAVLEKEIIGIKSDFPFTGQLPKELLENSSQRDYGIYITLDAGENPFINTLHLIPRIITIGIGCRKGKSTEDIEKEILGLLHKNDISLHAVKNIASIDLKEEEKGILEFCNKYKIPAVFFSSEELKKVQGTYSKSPFVNEITGVECVCERAAMLASEDGELLIKKTIENGITLAVAKGKWSVRFE